MLVDRYHKSCQRLVVKDNLPVSDVIEAVRKRGLRSVKQVALGVLETNGEITIVPKPDQD